MNTYYGRPILQYLSLKSPGNFLPETVGLPGKEGETYYFHGGLCLETQNFPDSVHHANFPSSILYPGQRYQHLLQLRLTRVST